MKNGTYVGHWNLSSLYLNPEGLVFDNDGYLHVSTSGASSVRPALLTFTTSGTLLQSETYSFYNYQESFDLSKDSHLHCMSLANDGTILLTETYNDNVVRISTSRQLDSPAEAIVDFGEYEEMAGDATSDFDGDIYIPLTDEEETISKYPDI